MDVESNILLATVLASLVFVAVAALTDTAMGSVHKHRMKRLIEDEITGAEDLQAISDRPERFRSTLVLANALAITIGAASATALALRMPSLWLTAAVLLVFSIALLSLGQVAPRIYAARHPERCSLLLGKTANVIQTLLSPVVQPSVWFGKAIFLVAGRRNLPDRIFAPDAEAVYHGNGSVEEQPDDTDEQDLIEGVFRFVDTTLREVMVPRIDIVGLEKDAGVMESIDIALKNGYSRIPVYDDNLDNIIGILYLKDLLKHTRSGKMAADISKLVRPAYFVPEAKRVDELLRELQNKRVHMAVVVDEYGGTAGLVTIEDLLEELVGEIQDEYDTEIPLYEKISDDEAVFNARASIDYVDEILSVDWVADGSDSLGGLLHELLGKIPVQGDSVTLGNYELTVLAAEGRRLKKIRVSRLPAVEPQSTELIPVDLLLNQNELRHKIS